MLPVSQPTHLAAKIPAMAILGACFSAVCLDAACSAACKAFRSYHGKPLEAFGITKAPKPEAQSKSIALPGLTGNCPRVSSLRSPHFVACDVVTNPSRGFTVTRGLHANPCSCRLGGFYSPS